jgi:iron(III) transport system ATP-binding protein
VTDLSAQPSRLFSDGDRDDPMTQPTMGVQVGGLCKSYGDHPILTGVELEVPEGSVTAILGPSGSGKTTLLRLLAGFTRPDRGTINVGGRMVDGPGRHVNPAARGVGYVPQEGSLFPHLDVEANIGFGVPRRRRRRRVAELLDTVGLAGLANRYPHQLSGGQQQRVALARALAPNPAVVLLDEPFSSLDAALRASVRHDVSRILADAGTTTVIVTHDQDEALSLADQVAVLRDGRIAQAAHPDEVYGQPLDADLARFVGEANVIDGVVRNGRVDTAFGPLSLDPVAASLAENAQVAVLLRPEQIRVISSSSQNEAVTGTVTHRDYHGHDALITIASTCGQLSGALTVRCIGSAGLAPGATVSLQAVGPVVAWPAKSGGL